MLAGYYSNKPEDNRKIEADLRKNLIEIKEKLDKILRQYEEEKELKIPKDLWLSLYDYEARLRLAWKNSGLQMSLRPLNDVEDF